MFGDTQQPVMSEQVIMDVKIVRKRVRMSSITESAYNFYVCTVNF